MVQRERATVYLGAPIHSCKHRSALSFQVGFDPIIWHIIVRAAPANIEVTNSLDGDVCVLLLCTGKASSGYVFHLARCSFVQRGRDASL